LVPKGVNQLEKEITQTRAGVITAYRANALQDALSQCVALVTRANQYIDQTSPFKLAKDPQRAGELNDILRTLAEVCRVLGTLLWPVMPGASEKIHGQLGFPTTGTTLAGVTGPIPERHPIGEVFPLFPRKDT
jgi:methionyl-tRNA synthetase